MPFYTRLVAVASCWVVLLKQNLEQHNIDDVGIRFGTVGGGLCVLLQLLWLLLLLLFLLMLLYARKGHSLNIDLYFTFVVLFSTRHGVTRKIDTLEVGVFFPTRRHCRDVDVNVRERAREWGWFVTGVSL